MGKEACGASQLVFLLAHHSRRSLRSLYGRYILRALRIRFVIQEFAIGETGKASGVIGFFGKLGVPQMVKVASARGCILLFGLHVGKDEFVEPYAKGLGA